MSLGCIYERHVCLKKWENLAKFVIFTVNKIKEEIDALSKLANFRSFFLNHHMNLINMLLTVLGSSILELVPKSISRVTGTWVRSGNLPLATSSVIHPVVQHDVRGVDLFVIVQHKLPEVISPCGDVRVAGSGCVVLDGCIFCVQLHSSVCGPHKEHCQIL